ncbi:MAG: translocation/assembly module TamB domain-containing protein [Candidatus Accumulibacter sp.]|jgi:translocation and assembly module TamB|nr:translocation/assembly module TamB domain-containing protein [Accumulibacter sp.]
MRFRYLLLLLILAVAGGAVWLVGSDEGLRFAAGWLGTVSDGRLAVAAPRGRLLGPLSFDELRWQSAEFTITAREVEFDWTPTALARNLLKIDTLRAKELYIDIAPNEAPEPTVPPDDLGLPLAVSIHRATIDALVWNGTPQATDIEARLTSDGRRHVIEEFSLRVDEASANGQIRLDGKAPFPLTARAELRGPLAGREWEVAFDADGPLTRIDLSAHVKQGIDGEARATLTPFAMRPIGEATAQLRGIDPSTWWPDAPGAELDFTARLEADEENSGKWAGHLHVTNHAPGLLDEQRIPLASASIHARTDGDTAQLDEIELVFPGDGALRGDGRWADAALTVNLDARRLDAARLVSRLIPTRLDGPLTASLGIERQSVRLAWHDERFRLTADAEHASGTLTVRALELAAGDALLNASGHFGMTDAQTLEFRGNLRRFDPSRFADLPAARIDAEFFTQGRLGPQPVLEGRFSLGKADYAGMPLAGQGRFTLDWPRIHDVEVSLSAGPNRIRATGGFGRAGDRLRLRVVAPRLAPFGIDGALRGRVDLTGTMSRPSLTLDLAASRLAAPEFGTLSGLTLQGQVSGEDDFPLDVKLAVTRFARPGEAEFARAVTARLVGRRRAHQLELDGEFMASARRWRARLAAAGGFSEDWRWLGHLRELRLAEEAGRTELALSQPAALEISPVRWSIGPLALAGSFPESMVAEPQADTGQLQMENTVADARFDRKWTAELRANADAERFQAESTVIGARFGRIEGRLEAGMHGPWQLATDAPWRGNLRLDAADLAWLGTLLGEGWRTGGKLAGTLALAGTPAQPRPSGHLDGTGLNLHFPEQGLLLTEGTLAVEFDDQRLRITRFGLSSVLTRPPRALRRMLGDDAKRFSTPGRLDVSGELRVGGDDAATSAFLDVQLDRFGAWQLPDQWVAVSGTGRISWRAGALDVSGRLGVDAGYWQLAPTGMPRLSDDVQVKKAEMPAKSGVRPNLDLDLRADLGRRFLFQGAGLQTRLVGGVRLSAHGRDLPRASGTILLRDGRFDAYGQQLDIERGSLTFKGLLSDPALDVRAVRKGMAVEAGVQVGGTAQRPVVRLFSDPDLPDTDKLAWLLLGHDVESMGAGDAAMLVSAAGELLGNDSGNVVRQLRRTFGIDEFGVRQGDIGGNSTRALSSRVAGGGSVNADSANDQILSVGKRLSSNATLAYEQSLSKAESVVKLTVNLTRQIAFVGRAGSDNALDVFYTMIFGLPPRIQRTRPEHQKSK